MSKIKKSLIFILVICISIVVLNGCTNNSLTSKKYISELKQEYIEKDMKVATEEDMDFRVYYDEGVCTLESVSKDVDLVVIPEEYNGYKVTEISAFSFGAIDNAFGEPISEACNVSEIVISDSVTDIQQEAFQYCTNLKKITFGANVEFLGEEAFEKCTSLKEIVLNDKLKSLPQYMFSSCTALEEVFIPDQITYISNAVFSHCKSLKKLHIPKNVKSIELDSFDLDFEKLVIYAPAGSYAEEYAKKNNISFIAE